MRPAGERLQIFQHLAVAQREALQDGARILAVRRGRGLAGLRAVRRDLGGHLARFQERIGIDRSR